MSHRARLRAIGSRDPEIANFARDAQQALDAVPALTVIQLTRTYAEPMSVPFDHEPKGGLLLTRVLLDSAPEDIEVWSSGVHFTYLNGALVIPELQGPTLGTRYRFTFLAVG